MRILKPSSQFIYAVEVSGSVDTPAYLLSSFVLRKKELQFVYFNEFSSWEKLVNTIPPKALCIWVINDGNVLSKTRHRNEQLASLDEVFPQLEKEAFMVAKSKSFFSICRKDHWTYWFDKIVETKLNIGFIYLGLEALDNVLKDLPNTIQLHGYTLSQEETTLQQLKASKALPKGNVLLGGEQFETPAILGFASTVTFLSNYSMTGITTLGWLFTPKRTEETSDVFKQLLQQQQILLGAFYNRHFLYWFKRFNLRFGLFFLCFGIVLLLWSKLSRKQYDEISQTHRVLQKNDQKLRLVLEDEQNKWAKINKTTSIQVIPFLDGILQQMPNQIRLDNMSLRTLKHPNTTEKELKQIIIKGSLFEKEQLNDWVQKIKSIKGLGQPSISQLESINSASHRVELIIPISDENDQ